MECILRVRYTPVPSHLKTGQVSVYILGNQHGSQIVMWTLAVLAVAACEPGPAYWMPHATIEHGDTGALSLKSRQRIACCGGILGAVPVDASVVESVYEHRGVYYAILSAETSVIGCPARTESWVVHNTDNATLDGTARAPHRSRRAGWLAVADSREIDGYTVEHHSGCSPFATAQVSVDRCAAACEKQSRCDGFVHHTRGTAGGTCGFCAFGGSRRIRSSSGQTVYIRRGRFRGGGKHQFTLHHPVWLVGGLFGIGALMAVAASFYSG